MNSSAIDKRTQEVRHNTIVSICRLSGTLRATAAATVPSRGSPPAAELGRWVKSCSSQRTAWPQPTHPVRWSRFRLHSTVDEVLGLPPVHRRLGQPQLGGDDPHRSTSPDQLHHLAAKPRIVGSWHASSSASGRASLTSQGQQPGSRSDGPQPGSGQGAADGGWPGSVARLGRGSRPEFLVLVA
jgi:hypothetical protein